MACTKKTGKMKAPRIVTSYHLGPCILNREQYSPKRTNTMAKLLAANDVNEMQPWRTIVTHYEQGRSCDELGEK